MGFVLGVWTEPVLGLQYGIWGLGGQRSMEKGRAGEATPSRRTWGGPRKSSTGRGDVVINGSAWIFAHGVWVWVGFCAKDYGTSTSLRTLYFREHLEVPGSNAHTPGPQPFSFVKIVMDSSRGPTCSLEGWVCSINRDVKGLTN
jgi:hypothetical protein